MLRDFNIKAVKTLVSAAANTQAAAGSPEKEKGTFMPAEGLALEC